LTHCWDLDALEWDTTDVMTWAKTLPFINSNENEEKLRACNFDGIAIEGFCRIEFEQIAALTKLNLADAFSLQQHVRRKCISTNFFFFFFFLLFLLFSLIIILVRTKASATASLSSMVSLIYICLIY
jgi:hypothetical protein